jgi:hypothetical protein
MVLPYAYGGGLPLDNSPFTPPQLGNWGVGNWFNYPMITYSQTKKDDCAAIAASHEGRGDRGQAHGWHVLALNNLQRSTS